MIDLDRELSARLTDLADRVALPTSSPSADLTRGRRLAHRRRAALGASSVSLAVAVGSVWAGAQWRPDTHRVDPAGGGDAGNNSGNNSGNATDTQPTGTQTMGSYRAMQTLQKRAAQGLMRQVLSEHLDTDRTKVSNGFSASYGPGEKTFDTFGIDVTWGTSPVSLTIADRGRSGPPTADPDVREVSTPDGTVRVARQGNRDWVAFIQSDDTTIVFITAPHGVLSTEQLASVVTDDRLALPLMPVEQHHIIRADPARTKLKAALGGYRDILADRLPSGSQLEAYDGVGFSGSIPSQLGTKLDWAGGGLVEISVNRNWQVIADGGAMPELDWAEVTAPQGTVRAKVARHGADIMVAVEHQDGVVVQVFASTTFGNNGTSIAELGLTEQDLLTAAADPRFTMPTFTRDELDALNSEFAFGYPYP